MLLGSRVLWNCTPQPQAGALLLRLDLPGAVFLHPFLGRLTRTWQVQRTGHQGCRAACMAPVPGSSTRGLGTKAAEPCTAPVPGSSTRGLGTRAAEPPARPQCSAAAPEDRAPGLQSCLRGPSARQQHQRTGHQGCRALHGPSARQQRHSQPHPPKDEDCVDHTWNPQLCSRQHRFSFPSSLFLTCPFSDHPFIFEAL